MNERTSGQSEEIRMRVGGVTLGATLTVPASAAGIVLFAHGSGSSRFSPRNRFVAGVLNEAGLATLLMDLLTPEEERAEAYTRHLRFDIRLLTDRLVGAVDWAASEPRTSDLSIGCFGASTGAAAALLAAVERPQLVRAVVSRGGRPDLAGAGLRDVHAPTLLIVGGEDWEVLALNRDALAALAAEIKQLDVVPGATHLFEEAGAMEEVARLTADWFVGHLAATPVGSRHA